MRNNELLQEFSFFLKILIVDKVLNTLYNKNDNYGKFKAEVSKTQ